MIKSIIETEQETTIYTDNGIIVEQLEKIEIENNCIYYLKGVYDGHSKNDIDRR